MGLVCLPVKLQLRYNRRVCLAVMKRNEYTLLIVLMPSLVTLVLIIAVCALSFFQHRPRPARMLRFIAVNTFGKVLYQSIEGGRMKLYFLGREVTDDDTAMLAFRGLSFLAAPLLSNVFLLFWYMLLVEGSYDCTEEFDCFEISELGKYHNEPLNCSSEVVVNGSIQIECFRISFNYAVATGAAYGLFKLDVFAVYLFSMFLFWFLGLKKVKKYGWFSLLGVCVVVQVIVLVPMYVFVLTTSPKYFPEYFTVFPPLVKAQYIVSSVTVSISLINMITLVPWGPLTKTEDPIDNGVGIPRTEEHGNSNGKCFFSCC